jgi:UDP-N-acetylglucosamine--N-acetylmuramyl-(pentapeptide) pyrophosphoryl-undecaprenol N-acetylglucosamine transferase
LTDKGKPAVIIPSPYVTNNHQQRNAEQLEKAGGAVMLLEQDCTAQKLYDTVAQLLNDRQRLDEMSKAQRKMSVPNAAADIANMIISMCR